MYIYISYIDINICMEVCRRKDIVATKITARKYSPRTL